MKIDRLETHDRLLHFIKDQSQILYQGAEDCLKKNPLSLQIQEKSPYTYLFAHPRTLGFDEKIREYLSGRYENFDKVPEKKIFWQPRLTKPEPQPNSYLFRGVSKTDIIEICWLLPAEELWDQYEKGNVTESNIASWSITQYKCNKEKLENPHPDDFSEHKAKIILQGILSEHRNNIWR
jgi:hypothetical protein